MRIAFVVPFAAEDMPLAEMLARYPFLECLPAALGERGHDLLVHINGTTTETLQRSNVRWQVVPAARWRTVLAERLYRWKRAYGPAYYRLNPALMRAVRRFRPHVVHISGNTMDLHLAHLLWSQRRTHVPVVAHYHGGVPAGGRIARLQRWNGRHLAAVCFTAPEQGATWLAAGVLHSQQQIAIIPESSSPFRGVDREAARAISGLHGDPLYLCAGRLHPIKDPLTVLGGFRRIAEERPTARLAFAYLTDELLPDMQAWLAQHPHVAERVTFVGRVPLAEMEALYSSADFLLQASEREWSGLAVLEAMSCGCIPIVTDIPSFRVFTAGGTLGRLFPIGDAAALAAAALGIDPAERATLSDAVQEHFTEHLSFAAMARELEALYARLIAQESSRDSKRSTLQT